MAIVFVLCVGLGMLLIEQLWPGWRVPRTRSYLVRALGLNLVQLALVLAFGWSVDPWLARRALWHWPLSAPVGALVGYVAITFVFYGWHRLRHENAWLWRHVHQLHHSPARIDVLQAFYKHPLEIACNTLLSGLVLFVVLGLPPEVAAWSVALSGVGELVYHWNVRTPRWLGWFFQRPEMHREHHREGVHSHNFSDLPLWDWLFGTLHNPQRFVGRCGFGDAEHRVLDMLRGRDVTADAPAARPSAADRRRRRVVIALSLLASAHMLGRVLQLPALTAIAAASAASPAPKVFTSHQGLETFSSQLSLQFVRDTGVRSLRLDDAPSLHGPYNRRNVYGALIAYAPVLEQSSHGRPMLHAGVRRALCGDAPLLSKLSPPDARRPLRAVRIVHRPRPGTQTQLPLQVEVRCD